jgi:hypothetical protein
MPNNTFTERRYGHIARADNNLHLTTTGLAHFGNHKEHQLQIFIKKTVNFVLICGQNIQLRNYSTNRTRGPNLFEKALRDKCKMLEVVVYYYTIPLYHCADQF